MNLKPTKHSLATDKWYAMTVAERLDIMSKVSEKEKKNIHKYHRACIRIIMDTMMVEA